MKQEERRIPRGQPEDYPRRIITGLRAARRSVTWEIAPGHVLLAFDRDAPPDVVQRVAESLGAELISTTPGLSAASADPLAHANLRWLFVPDLADDQSETADLFARLDQLRETFGDVVRTVTPIFRVEGTAVQATACAPLHQRMLVELHDDQQDAVRREAELRGLEVRDITLGPVEDDIAERLARRIGAESVDDLRKRLPVVLQITNPDPQLRAFDLPAELEAIEGVAAVDLDWRSLHSWLQSPGGAATQPPGWNLDAIHAPDAWNVTEGDPSVVVAVLDSGYDLAHVDFSTAFVAAGEHFNAEVWAVTGGAGGAGTYDVSTTATGGDGHGTAITGIVEASHVAGTEVRGVAPGCTVLPIALGLVPTSVEVGGGLLWAAAHGARVANMSLATIGLDYTSRALDLAWESGMVLCAAAGNGGDVSTSPLLPFPAWHPAVIAVGAVMDADGRRKVPLAPGDWGSQFGAELSVVAPGVSCETTDITGSGGFDPMADFITDAQATSIATPHVSGLAALIISDNPLRTNAQVRRAIERSCQLCPDYLASAQPRGSPARPWHSEVGYGLIDCAAALREAATIDSEGDMPDDPNDNGQLTADDITAIDAFVASVHGSDARCLHGYLFQAPPDHNIASGQPTGGRLYLTPDLDEWLDIPTQGIVRLHVYKIHEAPYKAVVLWVSAGVQLEHVRRRGVGDFLSGSIVEQSAGAAGVDLLADLLAQLSNGGSTSGYSTVRGPCFGYSTVRGPCFGYSTVRGPCH
jgi:subtilisin family serine protease